MGVRPNGGPVGGIGDSLQFHPPVLALPLQQGSEMLACRDQGIPLLCGKSVQHCGATRNVLFGTPRKELSSGCCAYNIAGGGVLNLSC